MEIRTLEGVDEKSILGIFNAAFADYFIHLQLTMVQLEAKMLADKTRLDLSVGVFENGQLVAFILHGFDRIGSKNMVYNGGTGVIPEKRGAGLTSQMYRFILPKLVKNGIDILVLEVIKGNTAAIKSYDKSGFKLKRELMCYKGEVRIDSINNDVELKTLTHFDWNEMHSFWDTYPTWQNSTSVVSARQADYFSFGAYIKNELVGYVVLNPKNNRILQIAVHKDFRRKGIGAALMMALQNRNAKALSIINVDKSSRVINEFLTTVGFKIELEQLELELDLNKKYL